MSLDIFFVYDDVKCNHFKGVDVTLYRKEKSYVHTTVNGQGKIACIRSKKPMSKTNKKKK